MGDGPDAAKFVVSGCRCRGDGRTERGDELVVPGLVHEDGTQGSAALAGGTESGEQRALDGEVQAGRRGDHHGVLAAQFQARRLEVPAAQLADRGTHGGRSGEADLVDDAGVQRVGQALERGRTVGEHHLKDPGRQPGVDEQVVQCQRARRRVLGRLPHHGVAAQQRRDEVPGRHRDGEVAGGHHGHHADRVAEGEQLLVRHLTGYRLAVQAAALAEEEVTGVDDLPYLAECLGVRLAHLGGDQPGQGRRVGLDEPPGVADGAAAHRCGYVGPTGLRGAGGPAGRDERAGVAELDLGDDLVGTGGIRRLVAHGLERTPGMNRGPADAEPRPSEGGVRR